MTIPTKDSQFKRNEKKYNSDQNKREYNGAALQIQKHKMVITVYSKFLYNIILQHLNKKLWKVVASNNWALPVFILLIDL